MREARLDEVQADSDKGLAVFPIANVVNRRSRLEPEHGRQPVRDTDINTMVRGIPTLHDIAHVGYFRLGCRSKIDAALAILIPAGFHILGKDIESLIPANGNEFPGTTLADALHRRLDAIGAVNMLDFR